MSYVVKEDRKFAIEIILSIRKGWDMSDMTCRNHTTSHINQGGKIVWELINWKNVKMYEPVFTCNMTINELESIKEQP